MKTISPSSRSLLDFFLFLAVVAFPPLQTSAATLQFDLPDFNPRDLTLLGDSHFKNGVVGLTLDSDVPSSSSGTVIYNTPVKLFDPDSNTTASFSTAFSFSIVNLNPGSSGDGIAFFLSPDNQTLGSPGGFLGLVNSSQLTKNRFVAVEFDTKLDPHFNDPNDNHVGLDIESLISVRTANLESCGVNLKNGQSINAWIDYKNDEMKLMVFVNKLDSKPETPILMVDVDLSDYLKEIMYLGFSGSTEGSTELHKIESWSFQTIGVPSPLKPRILPQNMSDSAVIVIPPFPDVRAKHPGKKAGLVAGIAVPSFFCVLMVVFFGWTSIQKRKGIRQHRCFKAQKFPGPREFTYKELKAATKGFDPSQIIGRGAFGTVYKAFFMSSGSIAAVKRSKHNHEGKSDFLAELSIIACLRHKNLVQLQGWCTEKDELLLVYEFMPNGSLDRALYPEPYKDPTGRNAGTVLPWPYRYNIAVGLASVLAYLHQECEQQVIHRDIKGSNIMLDGNFNPRLGDFGLARLMEHDKTSVSTMTAGTMGYVAPEYLQFGTASDKTDVFSYGVVVLELACGRRPIEKEVDGLGTVNLVDYVWGLYGEGRIVEAADLRLKGVFVKEEMEMLLMVGLSCAHPDFTARPSMRRVFQILNKESEPLVVPRTKPTLMFPFSLPLNIEDIVSDYGEVRRKVEVSEEVRRSCEDQFEIDIHSQCE